MGAEFHRIATEVTENDVPSRALRAWAKNHAKGEALRQFAKDIAQVAAMEPAVDAKLKADPKGEPTDAEIQAAVRNVITLLGAPGR